MNKKQCNPLQLPKALDNLAVSSKMVAFRKSITKDIQLVYDFFEPVCQHIPQYTGSRAEGTVCAAIISDLDIMTALTRLGEVTDLDNLRFWTPKHDLHYVLVMLGRFTHDGYVQLAAFPEKIQFILDPEYKTPFLKDGNVFLLSSKLIRGAMSYIYPSHQVNGPSITEVFEDKMTMTSMMFSPQVDNVYCLRCPIWPSQAKEWLTRKRRYGWPSQKQLDDAKHGGCFLVPVGFPGGPQEDTEWRISFSLQERDLVRSWKNTQVKCFVFMKILLKNAIQPRLSELGFDNIVSTYHLKTVMMWMVEETSPDFWTRHNLHSCIMETLLKLQKLITGGKCPHYFIKSNNLFQSKIRGQAQLTLLNTLKCVTENGLLFCIRKCSVINNAYYIAKHQYKKATKYYSYIFECECRNLISFFHDTFADVPVSMLEHLTDTDLVSTITRHHDLMKHNMLRMKTFRVRWRRIFQLILCPLYSSLGSHLLAQALVLRNPKLKDATLARALYWLEKGSHFDGMSGKLKLSLFYYMIGDYSHALTRVTKAFYLAGSRTIEVSGARSKQNAGTYFDPFLRESLSPNSKRPFKDIISMFYAFKFVCLRNEIAYLPNIFKYEIALVHAQVGGNPVERNAKTEGMTASMDSRIFAYVLLIMGYRYTGQWSSMLVTLIDLDDCIDNETEANPSIFDVCQKLNLLAQSHFICGFVQSAVNL